MSRRGRMLPSLVLVVWFLGGCAGVGVGPTTSTTGGPAILRASFKGRLDVGGELQRFEGTLALVPPDRLRVEITGPLGGVRAVVATQGERVLVLYPPTREYLDEPAGPATYDALLGLPLDTPALVDLIRLGDPQACPDSTPCERSIPLPGGPQGAPATLRVTRRGDTLAARPEPADDGSEGLRSLTLRLIDVVTMVTTDGAQSDEDLFAPAVPGGWTRVRLDPRPGRGALLRPGD